MSVSFAMRVVRLAVSRYGVDEVRAERTCQQIAQSQGSVADLLDSLASQELLTAEQVRELHRELEATRFDPHQPIADPEEKPNAGTLRFLGDYRLLRRLGEGGMGSVFLGYHEGQERQVAIKVLADPLARNRASVDRFYREARTGALLEHPCIVRGITAGQDQATGKHYIVQEFVDGPSVHTLLDRLGRLAPGDAVHIALDMARALEYLASKNFVHRDIKPDNILLTRGGQAKLADLGLAKRIGETSHLTALHQGFGSPYYMPCEQMMNARRVDGRSDIYALGATLYHLLTGEVPFPGSSNQEIVERKSLGTFTPASAANPEVPGELDRILARMLAREPRDRYQTASELFIDLEGCNIHALVPEFVAFDSVLMDPLSQTKQISSSEPTQPNLAAAPPRTAPPEPFSEPLIQSARSPACPCSRLLVAGISIGVLAAATAALCVILGS